MSDHPAPRPRKWIPRAWFALLVIAAAPFVLPFIAYGVYKGCQSMNIAEGASMVCDKAGVTGFLAFAWFPYVLAGCAIAAIVLLLAQRATKP